MSTTFFSWYSFFAKNDSKLSIEAPVVLTMSANTLMSICFKECDMRVTQDDRTRVSHLRRFELVNIM